MKKKSWLLLIPIAACVVLFMGYCMVDRISTDTKAPEIYFSDEMLQISVNDSKEMLLHTVQRIPLVPCQPICQSR